MSELQKLPIVFSRFPSDPGNWNLYGIHNGTCITIMRQNLASTKWKVLKGNKIICSGIKNRKKAEMIANFLVNQPEVAYNIDDKT